MFLKIELMKKIMVFFCVCFTLIISGKTLNAGDLYLPLIIKPCPDYFDDFSNPASGWEVTDSESAKTEYVNGEFRILLKQYGFKIAHPNTCPRENYSVEADLRFFNGIGTGLGIIFGASSKNFDRFYAVFVLPNESLFEVGRADSVNSYVLISETFSSVVAPGGSVNHIKIARQGSSISVYINVIKMWTLHDSNITGMTYCGLIVAATEGEGSLPDARFDNFRVLNLTEQ
jgi:hypothetical protein